MTTLTTAHRRGLAHNGTVLGPLATLLALWLALTASSVSPVPAPASSQTVVDGTDTDATQPVPPVDGRQRRGGR